MAYFNRSEVLLLAKFTGYDMEKARVTAAKGLKKDIMLWATHVLTEDR